MLDSRNAFGASEAEAVNLTIWSERHTTIAYWHATVDGAHTLPPVSYNQIAARTDCPITGCYVLSKSEKYYQNRLQRISRPV